MERNLLSFIEKRLENGQKSALVLLTHSDGSTPRNAGSIMVIDEKGVMLGSIGGGKLEAAVIEKTKTALKNGKDSVFHYSLEETQTLNMQCGGDAQGYIKVFQCKPKLLIIGAGHVGYELYKLSTCLNFHLTIIDDREAFANIERLPEADEIILGDIKQSAKEFSVDNQTYIVVVTRGHECDLEALKSVLGRDAAYIGVIGSEKKTKHIMQSLEKEGFTKEVLNKVYAPIGLDLATQLPNEIALGILTEILIIKNGGKLQHMKEVKCVKW